MNYVPLNDNVLLEIWARLTEHWKCRVMAVGPGMVGYNGIVVPLCVKVGDIVIIRRHAADWFLAGDKKLLLARACQLRVKVVE